MIMSDTFKIGDLIRLKTPNNDEPLIRSPIPAQDNEFWYRRGDRNWDPGIVEFLPDSFEVLIIDVWEKSGPYWFIHGERIGFIHLTDLRKISVTLL